MERMSRRQAISTSTIGCFSLLAPGAAVTDEAISSRRNNDIVSVSPIPIVACRKDQKERIEPAMGRFAKRFGIKGNIVQDDNPRCCVWFELVGCANPGADGWFFVHHGGGSLCYATNEKQLDLAVTALIAIADKAANQGQLPIGLTTSFSVNPAV
jgi:hypothetical protein